MPQLLVGLGNPWPSPKSARHNLGSLVMEALAGVGPHLGMAMELLELDSSRWRHVDHNPGDLLQPLRPGGATGASDFGHGARRRGCASR